MSFVLLDAIFFNLVYSQQRYSQGDCSSHCCCLQYMGGTCFVQELIHKFETARKRVFSPAQAKQLQVDIGQLRFTQLVTYCNQLLWYTIYLVLGNVCERIELTFMQPVSAIKESLVQLTQTASDLLSSLVRGDLVRRPHCSELNTYIGICLRELNPLFIAFDSFKKKVVIKKKKSVLELMFEFQLLEHYCSKRIFFTTDPFNFKA